MGMKNLPDIARHLLDAGMDPDTPAALVYRGTTPCQRSLVATISTLPQAAVVLADPLTLREERAVAQGLTRLVTLTGLGGECLARRMRLPPGRVEVINHGNLEIATVRS